MKKSVTVTISIIAVIVLAITVYTVLRGKKNVIHDQDGQTHVVMTNFYGEFIQDEYGQLFERATNSAGESITKSYIFPERVVNKSGTKIENAFIKLKIPRGWEDLSTNDKIGMTHKGACTDATKACCQTSVRYDIMADPDALYNKYKGTARFLVESFNEFDDFKEYETEIFGLKARAMSYSAKNENGVFYYYLVEQGLALFEIELYAHNDCYTEDEIKALAEKQYVLKDLGGERPEIPSTSAPSEEADATEASSTTTTTAAE